MALFKKKSLRKTMTPYCTAIIAAAGSSARMGGEDKLFAEINGSPVILHTLRAFQASEYIDEIIVVTREESIVRIADLCAKNGIEKATKILRGGETRQDSVLIGLEEASSEAKLIAIQDGARPLVTGEIIKETLLKALKYTAAVPSVEIKDTVKEEKDSFVSATVPRAKLRAVQTPQCFASEVIRSALENAKRKGLELTDDASAVEAMGGNVYLAKGSEENIKITTPVDLLFAEAILRGRGE